jgi:DNA helicase-2/ATP-dependent DNA helicase PcrA
MMTVHSAKGLEFKNVFVVGLEENLFPMEMSKQNPKELEEERRLFYVAITRAEENAILTYSKSRFQNGQPQMCSPSRFIKDIDRQYLKLPGEVESNSYTYSRKTVRIENEKFPTSSHLTIGNLSVGNSIRHERFGIGKIVELTGEDENSKATVEFENFGRKQLLLKFAKFEAL